MNKQLYGQIKVNLTDHEFAKFLRDKDPNWTVNPIGEYTQFICNKKIEAVVKYKNDHPVGRQIWIDNSEVKGIRLYCENYEYPDAWPPRSFMYEDAKGTFWLKQDIEKEFQDPCPDCGEQLTAGYGGGVKCPSKKCNYWFCY